MRPYSLEPERRIALRVAEDKRIVGVAISGGDQCSFGRFEKRLAISADSSAQI